MKEAIRMVLEFIYDSEFPDTSHFRSDRGSHSALRRIKEEWSTSRWFLEFDIRKSFHNIDRHRLIPIFKEEIDDPKFFYSIQKVFSAGRLAFSEKGPYTVPHSVLLSALPSNIYLRKLDQDLALGLEKSGVKFIWSVKEPTVGHVGGGYGKIPSGFEDRVAGRGLVLRGWAPQVAILSHRAVGSFLTHCGANSVLESVVAGVPMLAWPMSADQFSNATLLVNELKVAKRVCEGAETVPNSEELARLIAESVREEKRVERERAMELGKAAVDAIKEGGSSFKALDGLVDHFSQFL